MIWPILAVAFVLRVVGAGFGLPHLYHQDEPIVVNHALAYASLDFNPHFFKIPPLTSYLLFGLYGLYFLLMKCFAGFSTDTFALSFFKDPSSFYFLGRLVFGVFLGTASVAALHRLARLCLSKKAALFAALLLAVSFLHVRDSHYIYADIPMLFSILMAFGSLSAYQERGEAGSFWTACFWCGVSIAFKYIAAVILLPLFLVTFSRRGLRHALSALGIASAVYAALNPLSFLDLSFFMQEIRQQAASETAMPLLHHWQYSLTEGMGGWATAMGAVGLFWAWKREPNRGWLWGFAMLYYVMITVFSQPYERYAMPIVPFLCLGAAYFLSGILKRPLAGRKWLVGVLLLLALLPTFTKSVYLDHLMLLDDTRTLTKQWIEANVPAGTAIALDHTAFSPRLLQSDEQLQEKIGAIASDDPHGDAKKKKLENLIEAQAGRTAYHLYYLNLQNIEKPSFLMWSPLLSADLGAFRNAHVEYLVRHREKTGVGDYFERGFQEETERLAVFSPYKDPSKSFTEDEWANTALPFRSRELFSRERSGPVIEVYRLRSKA